MDVSHNQTDVNDDAIPTDLDSFRVTLQRRLADYNGAWRGCTSAECERRRRCCDAALVCVAHNSARVTPEQEAEAMFALRQALDARRGIGR